MSQIIFSDVLHFIVALGVVLYITIEVLHAVTEKYIKNKREKQRALDKEETAHLKEILAKNPEYAVFKTLEEWKEEGKAGETPDVDPEQEKKQMLEMKEGDEKRTGFPMDEIQKHTEIGTGGPEVLVDIQHGTYYGNISGFTRKMLGNGQSFPNMLKEEKLVNPSLGLPEPDKTE